MQLKYFLTFLHTRLTHFVTVTELSFHLLLCMPAVSKISNPTKPITKLALSLRLKLFQNYIYKTAQHACTPLNPIPITYYYYVPSSNPLKYEVVQRISFTVFTFLQLPKKSSSSAYTIRLRAFPPS